MEIILDSILALFASIGIWTVARMIWQHFRVAETQESPKQNICPDDTGAMFANLTSKRKKRKNARDQNMQSNERHSYRHTVSK